MPFLIPALPGQTCEADFYGVMGTPEECPENTPAVVQAESMAGLVPICHLCLPDYIYHFYQPGEPE